MSSQAERRSKTLTPESEKDDIYWEKRKRNNMAAKKSRESKRQIETAIKQRVFELEKDNLLLRRELSLIKFRFGIPENKSLLTMKDHDECRKMMGDNTDSVLSPIDSVNSLSSCFAANTKRESSSNSSHPNSAWLLFTDMYSDCFAESEAHAHDQVSRGSCHSTCTADSDDRAQSDAVDFMYDRCKTKVPRIVHFSKKASDFSENTFTVRDLSMKNRKRPVEEHRGNVCRLDSGDVCRLDSGDGDNMLYIGANESRENFDEMDLDDVEKQLSTFNKRKHVDESDSRDIGTLSREEMKYKLEALSEQVQRKYRWYSVHKAQY